MGQARRRAGAGGRGGAEYKLEVSCLKVAAWFSTLETLNVVSWFQSFAFKWVNLCRYAVVLANTAAGVRYGTKEYLTSGVVGLYKLNAVDP